MRERIVGTIVASYASWHWPMAVLVMTGTYVGGLVGHGMMVRYCGQLCQRHGRLAVMVVTSIISAGLWVLIITVARLWPATPSAMVNGNNGNFDSIGGLVG